MPTAAAAGSGDRGGPPEGDVTLVFTDVEGSTALWESAPEAMRAALRLHDGQARALLATLGGYEVKTEGDAFMVAFSEPAAAVRWCLDLQVALHQAAWSPEILARPEAGPLGDPHQPHLRGLRVRMGVHRGRPEARPDPVTGRMDYFGPEVNRAARVGAAGHGGQVVVSEAVRRALEGASLGRPHRVEDLGTHALKGLRTPERIFQVSTTDLPGREFPPLRTLDVPRTNLWQALGPLIGRDAERAQLAGDLEAGRRCVTLLGPAGIGKTSLAAAVARDRLAAEASTEVWFVDLVPCSGATEVAAAVARAVGFRLPSSADLSALEQFVAEELAERGRCLLVLDNAEHVVAAVARVVAGWLRVAPDLSVLVTSREPLDISSEIRRELGGLDAAAGARMFEDRAREAGWVPARGDEARIERLVDRLDRHPLALELAAGRVAFLPVAALLDRIDQRLDVLASSRRDLPVRHRSLRAAFDASWDGLDDLEQRVFARASVFAGHFTLEAGAEVLDLEDLGRAAVEAALFALRARCLLQEVPGAPGDEARFAMLESGRLYAAEHLEARPEAERRQLRLRHASYHAGRVRAAWKRLPYGGRFPRPLRAWMRSHLADLMRAMAAFASERPDDGAALALALGDWLVLEGLRQQGDQAIDFGLDLDPETIQPRLRSALCVHRAKVAFNQQRIDEAARYGEEAQALSACPRGEAIQADALSLLALVARRRGAIEEACRLVEQARRAAVASGEAVIQAIVARRAALPLRVAGRLDEALSRAEEACELARRVGEDWLIAWTRYGLGGLHLALGRLEEAEVCLEQALRGHAREQDVQGLTATMKLLSSLRRCRGDRLGGLAMARRAWRLARRVGDGFGQLAASYDVALIEFESGQLDHARVALAAVQEEARAQGVQEWELDAQAYLLAVDARRGQDVRKPLEALLADADRADVEEVGLDLLLGYCELAEERPDLARARLAEIRQRAEPEGLAQRTFVARCLEGALA